MKKVLVLGGNGFIGRNLCSFIADRGYEAYSFDMFSPHDKKCNIHYIEGDFFDDNTLKDILGGMDIVFHAISTLNPGNSNRKYMMGYERDFIQTVKLCEWIIESNKRMIFLSSGGTVYGNQLIQPVKETALPHPINHYGNLKLCIENTIKTFNYQANPKMLIARISNPYGPGQDYKKGVGFIDAVLKHAVKGETIEVWGDGEIIRDYIYIDDVCKMLFSLMNYEGKYQVFNLSSNLGISQNEILEIAKRIVPDISIEYMAARTVDTKRIILDNTRIMQINPFSLVGISDGINNYYRYICNQMKE